jgi:hypothetical protein
MHTSIFDIKKIVTKKRTHKEDDGTTRFRTVKVIAYDKEDNRSEITFFVTDDVKLLDSFED